MWHIYKKKWRGSKDYRTCLIWNMLKVQFKKKWRTLLCWKANGCLLTMHQFGMQVAFFSCTVHGVQVREFKKLVLGGYITFLFVCIHNKCIVYRNKERVPPPILNPGTCWTFSSLNYIYYPLICHAHHGKKS